MKRLKTIFTCFCLILFLLAVLIYFVGVNLVIENKSGYEVRNIKIYYGYKGDSLCIEKLQESQSLSKSLGKIGEGSEFKIQWIDDSGASQTEYGIYFYGGTGYETVSISFLGGGRTELVYDGEQKPEIRKKIKEN